MSRSTLWRRLRVALRVMAFALAALVVVILVWALIPASTPAFVDSAGKPLEGSIASMETAEIGGVQQFLLLRGRDRNAPVLLYLHGGPGAPETGLVRARLSALEDHFVVAYWEQRGSGRSFSPEVHREDLHPETLVSDTHAVIEWLKRRFQRDKVFLFGVSWGTYLAMREVAAHPESVAAYVGAGQLVHWARNETASYAKVLADARAAGNEAAIRELEALGPPVGGRYRDGLAGLRKERSWVTKLGGSSRAPDLGLSTVVLRILFPSEYSLGDSIRWMRGTLASMPMVEHVTGDQAPDLIEKVRHVEVPVFFVTGRHDGQTPLSVLEEYFPLLQAPRKELVVYEQSAHLVAFEEPARFVRFVVETVLPAGEAGGGVRAQAKRIATNP